MALNLKKVAALIAQGKPCRVHDGRGLYLTVESASAAHWAFRYQLNHRKRWMGLGSARDFGLPEARDRAQGQRQLLADKIDPLAARQNERAASARQLSFADATQQWLAAMSPGWTSPKHHKNVGDALAKWAFPIIGRLNVAVIDTPDILRVLQQPVAGKTLWTLRTTTADRLRNHVRLILDWSAVAGYRAADLPNPARWDGHLAMVLPAPAAIAPVKNQPSLDYRRVPELMTKLVRREGIGAAALRFTIMVASRISETANAKWNEIDLDEGVWTVPKERMKARREWRQPLAPQVIELLKRLPTEDGNPFVFIGTGQGAPISVDVLRTTLRREGYGNVVTHGFRSSFSDWAHERTAHANHAIELCLAHAVGSETERAYRRGDMFEKRRRVMADWADFITSPPAAIVAGDNVVPIGAAR